MPGPSRVPRPDLTDSEVSLNMSSMRVAASLTIQLLFAAAVPIALGATGQPPSTFQTINFGAIVTLSGHSAGASAGTRAVVVSRPCGFKAFVTVATLKLGSNGSFSYKAGPTLNTVYRVLIGDLDAVNLSVRVRPSIKLSAVAGARYRVEVTTGNGAGLNKRTVTLQRKQPNGRWKPAGVVRLRLISRPDQIYAVAAGTGIAAGTGSVRAALSTAQAAPCFAAAVSPALG